jgi:hypothetical protein
MNTAKDPVAIELLVEESGKQIDFFAPDTFDAFL